MQNKKIFKLLTVICISTILNFLNGLFLDIKIEKSLVLIIGSVIFEFMIYLLFLAIIKDKVENMRWIDFSLNFLSYLFSRRTLVVIAITSISPIVNISQGSYSDILIYLYIHFTVVFFSILAILSFIKIKKD
ncbi:hypothetical protein BMI76_01665 [Streptococcus sp. 'caviae']|nr:hypothetical protein BMI76_01665 [Streptococcus sp. 'caviae']